MREIGAACGVPRTYIYNLLRGDHDPRVYTRQRLAVGLAALTKRKVAAVRQIIDAHFDA